MCDKNGVEFLQAKLHLDLQGICGFFLRTDGLYKMVDSIKSYCSQQIKFIHLYKASVRGESIFVYFVQKQNGGDVRKETQFKLDFL